MATLARKLSVRLSVHLWWKDRSAKHPHREAQAQTLSFLLKLLSTENYSSLCGKAKKWITEVALNIVQNLLQCTTQLIFKQWLLSHSLTIVSSSMLKKDIYSKKILHRIAWELFQCNAVHQQCVWHREILNPKWGQHSLKKKISQSINQIIQQSMNLSLTPVIN